MFLYQPTQGYCYNSDSIFLYQFTKQFKLYGKLLDVGCGVGILSLLLSRDFDLETTLIDKQEVMLKYASHNFRLNRLQYTAYLGDFLAFTSQKKFDTIISNPPFYDANVIQSKNQHLNIARYATHLPIEAFFKKVKSLLSVRGYFIFCYDAKQIDRLLYHLKKIALNPEVIQFVHPKVDKEAKIVMILARNNSKSMTQILPPFIVFDEKNNYLTRAKEAFKKANTHSIKGDF